MAELAKATGRRCYCASCLGGAAGHRYKSEEAERCWLRETQPKRQALSGGWGALLE